MKKIALVLATLAALAVPAAAQVSQGVTVYNGTLSLGLVGKLKFSSGVCVKTSSGVVTCTISSSLSGFVDAPLSGAGTSASHLACPTCAVAGIDSGATFGVLNSRRSGGNQGQINAYDAGDVIGVRISGGGGGAGSVSFTDATGSIDTTITRAASGVVSIPGIRNATAGNQTTTVGVAGGASALPATPLGYLTIQRADGTSVKIPYYNP